MIEICSMCKKEFCASDANNRKIEVCPWCRPKFYAKLRDTLRILEAIIFDDYSLIKQFKIGKIRELGFEVMIK